MPITTIAQYKNKEFRRLLARVANERDLSFHCKKSTYDTIATLLASEYNGKDDDIDYLMDIVNTGLKKKAVLINAAFLSANAWIVHARTVCISMNLEYNTMLIYNLILSGKQEP